MNNDFNITKVKFSRHSKRRMKLYNISEKEVFEVIKYGNKVEKNNKTIHILKIDGNKYPLKVVSIKNEDYGLIITVYPLKREVEK